MGAYKKIKEIELSNGKFVVISKKGDGKYAIAQKQVFEDKNNPEIKHDFFYKNTIECEVEDLENVHDMIGYILDNIETRNIASK